ncbi:hypothetical protein K2X14_10275 [Acetobacter sp. TBRC 12305]|uniref:Uncharacterized protein n=1 Tax=Acetobacter garciniae TaxID=2817435 RepID=A0A939KQY9_9PROT|nr:hypothetical protein [Acetobacter garciniae]MBO1326037.1 hypothetical protein [Acetobacter garciniae]MBX0345219.1 hypothetical protein [Acetobacter garciniae]
MTEPPGTPDPGLPNTDMPNTDRSGPRPQVSDPSRRAGPVPNTPGHGAPAPERGDRDEGAPDMFARNPVAPDMAGSGAGMQGSARPASAASTSLDRDIGRLEGRVDSLERAVERLENSVNGLLRIIDFAKNGIRLVYAAIGLIGVDGVVRAVSVLAHLSGH